MYVNGEVMEIEVITKQDLDFFRMQLLTDIKELLAMRDANTEAEWLRSSDVRKLLKISHGTLQNLRIGGRLNPTKINGTYFYRNSEVKRLLEVGTRENVASL